MTAVFYLCATHHAKTRAGQKLLREMAEQFDGPFRACHIGCFHGDDRTWSNVTVRFLERLGARCDAPRLSDPKLDVASAREAIEHADLLSLDGGDTVAGVAHIRARGLLASFKKAARHARFVFGLSGGACAAGPYTIGYRGDRPYVADCLDMGPGLPLDVHDEKEDWPEMRALLALDPPHKSGLVIPTGGVLRVSGRTQLESVGKVSVERRSLDRSGAWRIEPLARARATV